MTERYREPPVLRRALEDRLKKAADNAGTDLARRRVVVFDGIAARLAEDTASGRVLKGDAVMEFRMRERAHTARDMDLAARANGALGPDGPSVRELLIEALPVDIDGDYFRFKVSTPADLAAEVAGRGGWRYSVEATLAGKVFATVRVDVVDRAEEISIPERLRQPNSLEFAGTPQRHIKAVDRRQPFAEMLHAPILDYGDGPNARAKDLVDLLLIIERGLVPDATVWKAVRHVLEVRATHPLPTQIPDPPPAWNDTYSELAKELTSTKSQLAAVLPLLGRLWAETRSITGDTHIQQRV